MNDKSDMRENGAQPLDFLSKKNIRVLFYINIILRSTRNIPSDRPIHKLGFKYCRNAIVLLPSLTGRRVSLGLFPSSAFLSRRRTSSPFFSPRFRVFDQQ